MSERIALDVRGSWLTLKLELEFPPDNSGATLVQHAAEELWLASRVLGLTARYHAGRTVRRSSPEHYVDPTAEHYSALAYLEEVAPMTADEDLTLALDPDELHELEDGLADGDSIADAYDAHDDPVDDEGQDDELDDDALEPHEDTGLDATPTETDRVAAVIERIRAEQRAPRPPAPAEPAEGVTDGALMRACQTLTAIDKLAPGRALAEALGIPGNRVAPYVRKARNRGWLPQITTTDGAEVDA